MGRSVEPSSEIRRQIGVHKSRWEITISVTVRRVTRVSSIAGLTVLAVTGAAGCASSHTSHASAAASSSLSRPSPAVSPSLSASTALPSSIPTSPAVASATPTTAPPPSGSIVTVSPSGHPPTVHLSDADANKTFVAPVGTVFNVTVQLRAGEGISIDPPSSANPPLLEQISADTQTAATTHGIFQAVAPGDTAIIVIENPAYQPYLSGVPSTCAAAAPQGFDFYITIVPANS